MFTALFVWHNRVIISYVSFALIGLDYGIDDQLLRDTFAAYGDVDSGESSRIVIVSYVCVD